MSERLPPPDFNSLQYERPNMKWVCGKASCGQACRLGPDSKGNCRVTAECKPACEIKPGEKAGRYRCTRPPEYGGPCPGGPLPDGSCCRPLTRCAPVMSLRARRINFTICAVILTTALLLVALSGPARWNFISPGPLSQQHSTFTFAHRAKQDEKGNCAVCHTAARTGVASWFLNADKARPGPHDFQALASTEPVGLTSIDQNCLECHVGHSFHEPNVASERSCGTCHVEHQGPGRMHPPPDSACLSCHADSDVMQASIMAAANLPAAAFDYRPVLGRAIFNEPRPRNGFTRTIHSFSRDHPEFQFIVDQLKDPDTLKFNHKLHLGSTNVAAIKGGKLTCSDCHQPDASGYHFQRISFDKDCQQCHSLQFDVRNPGLRIPHGDAEHVRAFLRSLQQQYTDYAAAKPGLGDQGQAQAYAAEQLARLRAEYGSGEDLERRVFFSDARWAPASAPGGATATGPAVFPGCAYCHEVKASPTGEPLLTDPILPDRWLIHGNFNHAKHLVSARSADGKVLCSECHLAESSKLTSDILLPPKGTCAECHSPKGGVSENCSMCHSYHTPRKDFVTDR